MGAKRFSGIAALFAAMAWLAVAGLVTSVQAQLPSTTRPAVDRLPAMDVDGDVEPTTKPVHAVQPPARETFHVYLLMGQSNMAGRDTRELAQQVDDPHVLAMTPDGQWVVARDPIHAKRGRTPPGAGPAIPFAREMLKSEPNITIGLIPCAMGGSSLRSWVKDAPYYKATLDQAKAAAKVGIIKGVLWHQGEADTTKQQNAETYGARLAKMFSDLRHDLNAPGLPIVVGQLGEYLTPDKYPFADTVRQAIRQMPTTLPSVGYADSAGLKDQGDGLHFNAAAQREFGIRYAHAMQALQK